MKYAIKLNPDKSVVQSIKEALKNNDNYCPCKIDKISENKCMCSEFKNMKGTSKCHCGLYYKIPWIEYVAVDFDGTIVTAKFPEIGEPNVELIKKLRILHESGIKIILHTCRENGEIISQEPLKTRDFLNEAIEWCKNHDVPIDAVNENPWVPFGGRKIYADIYLDDRAFNVDNVDIL